MGTKGLLGWEAGLEDVSGVQLGKCHSSEHISVNMCACLLYTYLSVYMYVYVYIYIPMDIFVI